MPFIPRQVKPPARQVHHLQAAGGDGDLVETLRRVPRQHPGVRRQRNALASAFRRDKEFQAWLAGTPAERQPSDRPADAAGRAATVMSFELILPFLRPIAHLIRDPHVTEIMVNGSGRVFVERGGRLEAVADVTVREQNLRVAVRNLARVLGDDISEERPLLDSRLPDGSRVAAALPPVSLGGTTLTIRKFHSQHFSAEELVQIGTLTARAARHPASSAIEARDNILISGGTGTGKTTLLNALAAFLPPEDRLVLIEDTAELQLEAANLVRFEARREQAGLAGRDHPRLAAGDPAPPTGSHPARRGAWRRGVRPAAGLEHRTLGHALDHSRELRRAGPEPVRVLRAAVRGRHAVSGRPPRHRRVPAAPRASRAASGPARGAADRAGPAVRPCGRRPVHARGGVVTDGARGRQAAGASMTAPVADGPAAVG